MNVAFRVDASALIGSGHFMRCLTLADRFRQRGVDTRFVCRWIPDHFKHMLAAKGHALAELLSLPGDRLPDSNGGGEYSGWLGVTQDRDAEETMAALAGQVWDWLVVDHYALDKNWESRLRACASGVLVIDDLANRDHDCDLLLDQNRAEADSPQYRSRVPDGCRLLLGPRYALLREDFQQHHRNVSPRQREVHRVFVFFGAVDANGYTLHAIHALANIGDSLAVDVVVGAQNPHLDEIRRLCARYSYDCHIQTDQMAALMASADLAIGAGGGNLWERCALGLPALVICTADNQRAQVETAARDGLICLTEAGGDVPGMLESHLKTLIGNRQLRMSISERCIERVDARGASRVVSAMSYRWVKLRKATPGDCEKIFHWRNHPDVRKHSRNAAPMTLEAHGDWYAAVLRDHNRILLIGSCDGEDLGVVRFDLNDAHEAEVSIYLCPARLNSRMGEPLLISAESWLRQNLPDVSRLRAVVLAANAPSQGLFLKAGYRMESTAFIKQLDRVRTSP